MENAAAIEEEALRQRLTSFVRIMRICLLTQQGAAEAAEETAAPLVAEAHAVYAKLGRMTPKQGELWTCLSGAQRLQGRLADARRSLQTLIERGKEMQFSPELRRSVDAEILIEQALIELDSGEIAAAQATMDRRLAISREMGNHPMYPLAYGRVLLASGQAGAAGAPLRVHYEGWRALNPDNPHTAEALYWLGRAREAAGEASGRTMVAEALAALARSPVKAHRRLAEH